MLSKAVTGEELSGHVDNVVTAKFALDRTNVLCMGTDRASVNGAAYNVLKPHYPKAINVGCFSHTISSAGDKVQLPALQEFLSHWNNLIGRSGHARLLFVQHTGVQPKRSSETRWFATFEILHQLFTQFPLLIRFLDDCVAKNIAPATVTACQQMINGRIELYLELAAIVDGFLLFDAVCHKLEGDSFLRTIS